MAKGLAHYIMAEHRKLEDELRGYDLSRYDYLFKEEEERDFSGEDGMFEDCYLDD